jgi:hypothetical protein
MPFNPESAKAAGQKSKRGPSKLLDPNIKEKMEILYPKTKPIRDEFTIQKLTERESIPFMERGPYPTK